MNLYGQKKESLGYKIALKNYFDPIKIMGQKSDFRGWGLLGALIFDLSCLKTP
jgi:hypothetical protein